MAFPSIRVALAISGIAFPVHAASWAEWGQYLDEKTAAASQAAAEAYDSAAHASAVAYDSTKGAAAKAAVYVNEKLPSKDEVYGAVEPYADNKYVYAAGAGLAIATVAATGGLAATAVVAPVLGKSAILLGAIASGSAYFANVMSEKVVDYAAEQGVELDRGTIRYASIIGAILEFSAFSPYVPDPNVGYSNNRDGKDAYSKDVRRATEKTYNANDNIDPYGLRGREHGYDLDHVMSVEGCWRSAIPASSCSWSGNLRMVDSSTNRSNGAGAWTMLPQYGLSGAYK